VVQCGQHHNTNSSEEFIPVCMKQLVQQIHQSVGPFTIPKCNLSPL